MNRTLVRDYGITRRSANLEINWARSKKEEELLKNIKLDDRTTFIQRLIWKFKYWFNWITAKRRPETLPASSLYRFKYIEPKSIYRGLTEEEVSLILEEAGGLDMHTTLLTWANKRISRGSIRNFNELIDAKDYLNIKGWIGLLRIKYEENKYSKIIDFLLAAGADGLFFVYLPFFLYEVSIITTPFIILFFALFLRPIYSFSCSDSDTYFTLDLELNMELDIFSKTKIKMFQRILGLVGIIIYFLLIPLLKLPLIKFLLLWGSLVLIMSTYD